MRKITLFLLLCVCTLIIGQTDVPKAYPSPEATNLGLVGNIPVSNYTGKMNLSIPLFDLKADNYEMPISLSYNSSGFIPNLVNGWVGQNWTLNAGGVITRVVKGLPDEMPVWGFYYTYQHLSDINFYVEHDLSLAKLEGAMHPEFDAEPDEFYFNVNGLSGKFYLNEQGTFTVISEPGITVSISPFENLRNIYNPVGKYTEKTFYGFTITDMDGTIYRFGYDDNLIETSSSEGEGKGWNWDRAVATSWFLTDILLSQRNERITFTYSPKYFDVEKTQSYTINNYGGTFYGYDIPCSDGGGYAVTYSYINHIYLESIESSTFKVNFHSSDMNFQSYFTYSDGFTHHWQKLDSIVIQGKNPVSKINKANFIYNIGKRTFLNSVQIEGAPPYEFDYYVSNTTGKDPLNIGFDTPEIDHWGYYNGSGIMMNNGEASVRNLLPYEFYFSGRIYFDPGREAEPDYTQVGMLKKIKYPTGSEKEFEYEPNDFSEYLGMLEDEHNSLEFRNIERAWSDWESAYLTTSGQTVFNSDYPAYLAIRVMSRSFDEVFFKYFKTDTDPLTLSKILELAGFPQDPSDPNFEISIKYKEFISAANSKGGGLRIKKITTVDGNSTKIKEYKYIKNFSPNNSQTISSGFVGSLPVYSFGDLPNPEHRDNSDFKNVLYRWGTRSSNSFTPLNLTQGANVGYSEVAEITKTGNGETIGYVVYKYTNFNDFTDDAGIPILCLLLDDFVTGFSFDTDRLPRTSRDLFRGKLLSETVFSRQNIIVSNTTYKYTTINREPIKAMKLIYLPLVGCTSKSRQIQGAYDYEILNYSYLLNEKTDKVYNVDGINPVETTSSYAYNDYNQITQSTVTNSDNSVIKTTYKYPTDFTVPPYTTMSNSFYHILSPVIEKAMYNDNTFVSKEKWDYNVFAGRFFPEYYRTQYGTGSLETKIQYHEYDGYGNPLYITTKGINQVYLWTHGQFLQAIIQNTTVNEVSQHLGQLTLDRNAEPDMSEVEILRTLLPSAQITTYTYKPLVGMTSQTDPRGVTTYYEYDDFNRLKFIKDNQGDVIQRFDYHYKE